MSITAISSRRARTYRRTSPTCWQGRRKHGASSRRRSKPKWNSHASRRRKKTVELKNSATKTATAALNGINSLLGGNKVSRLESENRQLHGEVVELKESIGQMRTDMQKMKESHVAERLRVSEQHQREIGNLRRIIDKAKEWFPMLAEFFRIERLCRSVGLSERHTDELLQGKVLVVTGKLHSDEYRRSFAVEKARLQVGRGKGMGRPYLTCSWTKCRLPRGSRKNGRKKSNRNLCFAK